MRNRKRTVRRAEKPIDAAGKPFTRRVEQGCQVLGAVEHLFARQWTMMIDGIEPTSAADVDVWL